MGARMRLPRFSRSMEIRSGRSAKQTQEPVPHSIQAFERLEAIGLRGCPRTIPGSLRNWSSSADDWKLNLALHSPIPTTTSLIVKGEGCSDVRLKRQVRGS